MVATLKTSVVQEPSSGTANLTLDASGGVTVGQNLTVAGTTTFTGGSTFTGNATAAAFIPSGSTVPTNGLYRPAVNTVGLATNSTNALYIDSSQNVGIGTSSPGNKLDIESNLTSQIRVGYTAGGATAYYDLGRDSADGYFGINGGQASPFVGYKWKIQGTEAMRIDSSGNVGIGLSNPARRLHVYVNNAQQDAMVQVEQAGAGSPVLGFLKTGVYAWMTGLYTTDNSYRIAASGADLNTNPRLVIDTSGNLLVGTTSASGRVTSNSTTSSAPQLSFQGSPQYTIANGSNTVVLGASDIAFVGVRDSNNTGQAAFFAMTGSQVSLIWQSGSLWSVTTTPSAGNFGFAYNGSNYAIYNNRGSSVNFQVGAVKFA